MEQFKKGVDVYGWVGCIAVVGILWLVCLWESLHDYFIPNAIELSKLITALLGTIVIWLLHLLSGGRSWLESQKSSMEWMAEHDLAMIDKMDKLHISKLQDVHNIISSGGDVTALGGEGIGED